MSVKLILPWVGELPWYWPLFESSIKNAGVVLVLVRGVAGISAAASRVPCPKSGGAVWRTDTSSAI